MFQPRNNLRKYDRNIFDGSGDFATFKVLEPTELLYYFKGNTVVGTITDIIEARVYRSYQRGKWLPVQVFANGLDHCGWVDTNKIELVS